MSWLALATLFAEQTRLLMSARLLTLNVNRLSFVWVDRSHWEPVPSSLYTIVTQFFFLLHLQVSYS